MVRTLPTQSVLRCAPALLLTAAATLLAFAPQWFPPPLALALGLLLLFFYPGYLLEQILFSARELTLTRLPVWFAFSLAIWAVPATALQLLGAHWFAFRMVFVAALWGLSMTAIVRRQRRVPPPSSAARTEIVVELALGALCAAAAFIVARGPRDGDDWMYLQIVQQMIASDPFRIHAASELRYSIRFVVHVWIFSQAFLGQWLNADVVTLVREILPTLLAPLALVSFYAWGKTFFDRARAALLAVAIQFAILATFVRGDALGMGFFARAAQDKFLVWLVLLPMGLAFAWRYLRDAKRTDWFAYGAVIAAAMWVHPVSLFLIVLTLGGFALFNVLSRAPVPRRRWLALTLATSPVLLSPIAIRATTLPAVFTVNTPEVAPYLRLSQGRLLFQPPFYIADPALLGHPAILLALALLVLFAPRVRDDVRVQFLWGSTLVPLALLFNPYTARVLGEMLTPWQLWRMTWNLPVAFILTEALLAVISARHVERRESSRSARRDGLGRFQRMPRWKWAASALALLVGLVGAVWLADLNWARSWKNLTSTHALEVPVQDMMQTLRVTLHQPALVLLPRDITRYAPAYTANALVLTDNAHMREGLGGKEIDRFYQAKADAKFFEAFLEKWKIEYAVVANGSAQDNFLRSRPRTESVYRNSGLSLYHLER
jgi:hypothetical protein